MFEYIENSIPPEGAAILVVGFGKITITPNLQEELIKMLPEDVQRLYFSKVK